MFNISRSTHSKDPIFGTHEYTYQLLTERKKSSVGASGEERFRFN